MLASGAWVGAIALVVIVIVLMASEKASGQTMNRIIIDIEPYESVIDVEPGNPTNGVLLINGTIRVKNQTDPEIRISLASTAGGWETFLNPSDFLFRMSDRDNRTEEFTIMVKAPIGYTSEGSKNLIIGGSWTSGGLRGDIDEKGSVIFVKQFYSASVEVGELHLADVGGSVSVPIGIWNTGNGPDEYSIRIENKEALVEKGFRFERVPIVSVDQNYNRIVRVRVHVPEDAGTYTIVVNVTSLNSVPRGPEETRTVMKTFHIRVEDDKTFEYGLVLIGAGIAVSVAVVWRWQNGSWTYY